MSSNESQPFVSVIVPVCNGASCIAKNIESLLAQTYPKDRFEIIVVDNGSTDGTEEIVKKYPALFLQENKIRTSYAARNKGLAHACGDIVAFTDADCVARRDWISWGVASLLENTAGIVGGKISFTFSQKPTAAELTDSIINLHNESSVARHRAARTANLFAWKKVFGEIGFFDARQKSGGDMELTGRAARKGCVVAYSGRAVVDHPARNFRELLRKHFRTGTGSIAVWRGRGKGFWWRCAAFAHALSPAFPLGIPRLVRERGIPGIRYPVPSMMGIAYLCKLASALGILYSLGSHHD